MTAGRGAEGLVRNSSSWFFLLTCRQEVCEWQHLLPGEMRNSSLHVSNACQEPSCQALCFLYIFSLKKTMFIKALFPSPTSGSQRQPLLGILYLSFHTFFFLCIYKQYYFWASQVVLVVKGLPVSARDVRDVGSIPGSGRSPGGGYGNLLQDYFLENPGDSGAWWAAVCMVARSQM